MNIRYRVELSEAEQGDLQALLSGGTHAARQLKRAQILLAAAAGVPDEAIATSVGVGGSTVSRTKRRFVEGNLERALSEEPRPGAARKLSGKEEALLVATVCAKPPTGRARWTLELLAGEMVRLTPHASLSRETVRRRLSENALKPWRQKMWCIPQVNGEYVARMEDVLDLYAEVPDPKHPVVCFDESPTQLIGETRQPIPAAPGQGALRLRVSPPRHDQSVRAPRRASALAQGDGHGTAHSPRLCRLHARAGRCRFPAGRADPGGDGQPVDAHARGAL
jgi:transposase